MDGMPELQEQIPVCPWMDGMPAPRSLPARANTPHILVSRNCRSKFRCVHGCSECPPGVSRGGRKAALLLCRAELSGFSKAEAGGASAAIANATRWLPWRGSLGRQAARENVGE